MNAAHTNQLFEDFPALYAGRHLPVTVNLMSLGFDCGDGWFELLYDLSQQLQQYNLEHPEATVTVVQVKEKFGSLRFYVDQPSLAVEAAIATAALKSLQTCALTGRPGRLHQHNGYYQTLCSEKAHELGFELVQREGKESS
jgi:hypothetical protein